MKPKELVFSNLVTFEIEKFFFLFLFVGHLSARNSITVVY